MSRLARVAGRFHAAASTYDQAAPIQRRIAQALADAIAEEALPEGARVLVLPRLEPELWIASDIAPSMLAQARAHLDYPALQFAQIDAAKPGLNPDFDLVCSSLTLQWMDDPAAVVRRWREPLRPGGVLGFSTLLAGSFGEWRRAVIAAGAAG
jgi:malonyl-CoA O-methyltransferase